MNILGDQHFNCLVKQNIHSDFFAELATGELNKNTYADYLKQDGIYLFYYQIALEQTAQLAPNHEVKTFFNEAANAIGSEVAAQFGYQKLAQANEQTLSYIDYLMAHTRINFTEALSAIFPCFYVYYAVANYHATINSTHPYHDWFSCYQSELFTRQTKNVIKLFNRYCFESKDSDNLVAILNKGTELELAFHQALMAKASLGAT